MVVDGGLDLLACTVFFLVCLVLNDAELVELGEIGLEGLRDVL